MTFAAPWFLLGLTLIPIVVWLHFIRQAKRERKVSALWLWGAEEAPERRAKFNPNILLLLQILTVLLASLGASAPRFTTDTRERILIIDAGAAMTAKDILGINQTISRLESAKELVKPLLNGRVTVIRAGLSATISTNSQASFEVRQKALQALAAGDSSSQLEPAIALAKSISPRAEILVFTSQAAPSNFKGTWHRILGDGANVGITAFAIRGTQVFAAFESNQNKPITAKIRLTKEAKTIAQTELKIPVRGTVTWTPKITLQPGTYKLELQNPDALELDNQAYAYQISSRVLVTPPQDDVLKAIVSVPGIRTAARDTPPSTARGYDAIVLVGAVPRALPDGNYIIFAPLPAKNENPKLERITRSNSTDPILRFVNLEGVRVRRSTQAPPELTGGTWTPIVYVGDKPLIWRGSAANVRAVYIATHPLETELRKFPAFPVLLFNIIQEYANAKNVPLGTRLGTNITFQDNIASGFTQALLPGVYTSDGERLVANLGSSQATRFENGQSNEEKLGADQPNTNINSGTDNFSPWRLPLLILALVALLLEAVLRGQVLTSILPKLRRAA
jgi:Ca-activated chloride channel homolog